MSDKQHKTATAPAKKATVLRLLRAVDQTVKASTELAAAQRKLLRESAEVRQSS
jgi:hypothetical protein